MALFHVRIYPAPTGVPSLRGLAFAFQNLPMTRNLKRYYGHGDFHFIAFSCYHRFPFLRTFQARETFISSLSTIHERYRFLLVGYVVMPEHIRLLISEIPAVTRSVIVKVLKHHVSVNLERCPTPLWQPRFYDFNVGNEQTPREKLDFIHSNPLKRGLVKNPADWPSSSYLNYQPAKTGLIPIDYV